MENIIKISSEQGFSETWKPASEKPTQTLLDFVIPANSGTYDLSKCHINLNMEVVVPLDAQNASEPTKTALYGSAFYNTVIVAEQDKTNSVEYVSDAASIVRNADMFSANRGMVESIRRVDTLRQLLWNMENDKAEQHDGVQNIGNHLGRRGPGNETSSYLQIMGGNTRLDGTVDESIVASGISNDLRINLSDLFGVGSALWNSDVYGSTRIHLEMDMERLKINALGGNERTSVFQPAGQNKNYGDMLDFTVAAGTGQLADNETLGRGGAPLITAITYDDYQLQMPFYVGQAINVTFTHNVTTVTDAAAIISGIEYNIGTNSAGQPNGTGNVRIYTSTVLYTNGTGAPENVTNISIKAMEPVAANLQIRVNRAEIVLSNLPSVNGPDSIDYRTYSSEETQGSAGLLTFNKQIFCEPNAQNLLVAHCNTGETSPDRAWSNYRMAIDNVDVSGNRDIVYNAPLHRDRISRTFNNRGQNISNFSLNALKVGAAQTAGGGARPNQIDLYPIFETLPLTQAQKIINFKLTAAAAVQDVIFYKELVKTI